MTERRRRRMVDQQIAARGVRDPDVLQAMREVPRERFVAEHLERYAYEDRPLPIADGQTISQPYIVALMAEAARVEPSDRVLEVGTGSGYGAAVLDRIAGEVWTIERYPGLADGARTALHSIGSDDVHVVVGDGSLGIAGSAPFDAIVVTAGGPEVPEALMEQLAVGGRLVMPVGSEHGEQDLVRVIRRDGTFDEEDLGPVRFVPLIGAQGFAAEPGEDPGADEADDGTSAG